MLRIQRDDLDDHRVTLTLQGRITGEWAELLVRECEAHIRSGFQVTLDLSGVVFIGRSGVEALRRLVQVDVRMENCSPLIAAVLEQEGIR